MVEDIQRQVVTGTVSASLPHTELRVQARLVHIDSHPFPSKK